MSETAIGVWLRPEYCPAIVEAKRLHPDPKEELFPQDALTPAQMAQVIKKRDDAWAQRDRYWAKWGVTNFKMR